MKCCQKLKLKTNWLLDQVKNSEKMILKAWKCGKHLDKTTRDSHHDEVYGSPIQVSLLQH